MARISMDQAVARRGVPRQTLEAWAEQGLLTLHPCDGSTGQQGSEHHDTGNNLVDEDELDQLVESLGWLQLSGDRWDESEEE